MRSIVALVSLVFLASVTGQNGQKEAPSRSLLRFLSMMSGTFTNKRQALKPLDGEVFDYIKAIWQPVEIPELYPAVTMHNIEITNGVVYRSQVWVFSEEDNIIKIQPRNVTRIGDSNQPWVLETVDDQCKNEFIPVEEDLYMGTVPDCTRVIPGMQMSYYGFAWTCHSFGTFFYFATSRETSTKLPYIFRNTGRFPLPERLLQSVDPGVLCDNS